MLRKTNFKRNGDTSNIKAALADFLLTIYRYVVWSVRGSGNLAKYLLYSSNSMSLNSPYFLKKLTINIFFNFK